MTNIILQQIVDQLSPQPSSEDVVKTLIRGGERKEKEFETENIAKQAFFSYFLLDKEIIAARGRGGGLALWCKSEA